MVGDEQEPWAPDSFAMGEVLAGAKPLLETPPALASASASLKACLDSLSAFPEA